MEKAREPRSKEDAGCETSWEQLTYPYPYPPCGPRRHAAEHFLLRWWDTYGQTATRYGAVLALGGLVVASWAALLGGIAGLVAGLANWPR
jgi:hypothetical protein